MSDEEPIVQGITLDANRQATIAPALGDVLFDLAIALEEACELPVDVQHVVAALVLAARRGELSRQHELRADDDHLLGVLAKQVQVVFTANGGRVSGDD